jgi:hypothetical protein
MATEERDQVGILLGGVALVDVACTHSSLESLNVNLVYRIQKMYRRLMVETHSPEG